jgi:hypothetical protein
MIIFETQNSTYELDQENSRIRRLWGKSEPTGRFSPGATDSEGWAKYATFEVVTMLGDLWPSLVIGWADGESPTHTVTSPLTNMKTVEWDWDKAAALAIDVWGIEE